MCRSANEHLLPRTPAHIHSSPPLFARQFRTAMDKYKHKRREVRDMHDELSALHATLEDMSLQDNDLRRVVEQAEANLAGIDRDLAEQQAKLARATKQASRVVSSHREKAGGETLAELDFAYKQARSFNQRVRVCVA